MTDEQAELRGGIRTLGRELTASADLDPIVERGASRRFIAIGEASHGTHEFYEWRAELTRRLIVDGDATWVGVEGDWPDCWRLDRWVRGLADADLDARGVLAGFDRWPTWMWANVDVADFLDWLREHNRALPAKARVGFYGLDVYSLWDSLARVMDWLDAHAPEHLPLALQAWRCFAPFGEDPQRYAWSTRLVPSSCEADVVGLLSEVRRRALADGDDAFDAVQNAHAAAGAERYYRAMVRTDRASWNIRDTHMADTVARLTTHLGASSKGVLWAHNTHVGDARATPMAEHGMLNLGQLLRERHGEESVLLVGMAGHRGDVLAAPEWGRPDERMPVPEAHGGSHENLLHRALGAPSLLDFSRSGGDAWLRHRAGHRAIGVVYDPGRESAQYVPTVMGRRYDALLWFEEMTAITPLRHEPAGAEREYETEPSGL